MKSFKSCDRKGFTLVEILLVVFLIALLSTAAISSYMNSIKTFSFLSQYKQVISAVKTARSIALTNKHVADPKPDGLTILPERYGVYIDSKEVFVFADVGDEEVFYDKNQDDNDVIGQETNCNNVSSGGVGGDEKYDVLIFDKCVNLKNSQYLIKPLDSNKEALGLPVVLFYKIGTGELEIRQNGNTSDKNEVVKAADHKCISFEFSQIDSSFKKHIVLFQISGLAEDYNNLIGCGD